MGRMSAVWTESSHGVDWRLELEDDFLIPGRLAAGKLTAHMTGDVDARSLIVALRAEEHWKHQVTTTNSNGTTSTHVVTEHRDLVNEPVQVAGELHLTAGETRSWDLELPVPPLGPASLEADVAGLDWTVVAKLDVPGGTDASIERSVRVAQPVALLRSGAVPLGAFALFGPADVAGDGVSGTVSIDPVPLCAGQPFAATVVLHAGDPRQLQEIRAELRVQVKATVSEGLEETILAWAGSVAATELTGDRSISLNGTLDPRALPSIELPHGAASATFHVILATAWAPDPHLVRDVAIATTLEL